MGGSAPQVSLSPPRDRKVARSASHAARQDKAKSAKIKAEREDSALPAGPGVLTIQKLKGEVPPCETPSSYAIDHENRIGWGKCYRSESLSQVLAFLNKIWEDHPEYRPNFIAYDKACELLRHIVTQDAHDLWLTSTKFIVDAWHYIGHRANDILCRTRCNPAPTDGSQPDLVLTEVDEDGNIHQTRAFNTETAKQDNSWLNGFESQLRQMTDINYDFYVHVLMMIYGETVEKRVVQKGRGLTQEFWDEVNGDGMDVVPSEVFYVRTKETAGCGRFCLGSKASNIHRAPAVMGGFSELQIPSRTDGDRRSRLVVCLLEERCFESLACDVDRFRWWVVDIAGGPVAARVDSHLIVVNDQLFIFGGNTYENGQFESTESYNIANNRWTWQVRDVPYPPHVPALGFCCDAVAIQDVDSPKILLTVGCRDINNTESLELVARSFVLFDIGSTSFTTQLMDNGDFPGVVSCVPGALKADPASTSALICTFHTDSDPHPELYMYSLPPQGGCKKLGLRQRIAATKKMFELFAVVGNKMYLFGWTKDKWDILAEIPQQLISA
ncbi:hypothetical protein DFH06DRAFT_1124387 [Mycena polygramma]|nr:hypothetical protein DFH06DRAFT_1124387 [Mycena polygramma]